jgi:hypothetical protein
MFKREECALSMVHFGHVKRRRRGDNSNNELDDSRTLHRCLEATGVRVDLPFEGGGIGPAQQMYTVI